MEGKIRKVLIGVDLQNDFINGSMAVKGAEDMVHIFNQYVKKNYDDYLFFALTMDWHPYNHSSFSQFPRHCVAYSSGASLHNEVIEGVFNNKSVRNKVSVYQKGLDEKVDEFSIFQNKWDGSRLLSKLKFMKPDEIHVCGLVNEFCVFNTVKDLVDNGYKNNIVLLSEFILDMGNPNILYDYAKENNIKII